MIYHWLFGNVTTGVTTYVFDDFTRANEHPVTGPPIGGPYVGSGAWSVVSNALSCVAGSTSNVLFSDSGHSNALWELTVSAMAGGQDWGLIFRSDGDNTSTGHYWLLQYDGTHLNLYKYNSGYIFQVGVVQTVVPGDTIKVVTYNDLIECYINNTHLSGLDRSDTFQLTSTYAGVYAGTNFSDEQWSLLKVTSTSAPIPPSYTSPSDIAGLSSWYKSDVGVYQDIAGTIPATNGNYVRLWKDQAGTRDLHSEGGELPNASPFTYATNSLNGQPTLPINSTGQGLIVNDTNTINQPGTVFVVWKSTSAGGNVIDSNINGNARWTIERYTGNHIAYAGVIAAGAALTQDTWIVSSAIFNGSSGGLWRTGTADPGSANTGTNAMQGFVVGRGFDGNLTGAIAELLVYTVALGFGDRMWVENYLKTRYGL